jgi:hypothetical protein
MNYVPSQLISAHSQNRGGINTKMDLTNWVEMYRLDSAGCGWSPVAAVVNTEMNLGFHKKRSIS